MVWPTLGSRTAKEQNRTRSCCSTLCSLVSNYFDNLSMFVQGLKPYVCGFCGHATALRGNCNQHIRKSHPGMPVCVVDRLATQRRNVKDYDYAGIVGDNIREQRNLHAAGWTDSHHPRQD